MQSPITVTPVDLYAFGGSKAGPPRLPRIGTSLSDDLAPDADGMVGPQSPPFPLGASTFADFDQSTLTGRYHLLPRGTVLPPGLAVMADGQDVHPGSKHPPTHYTLYPIERMTATEFVELFKSLPWQYKGKR